MKQVLVPMDFSEVSVNALKYAYAMFPDAHLHVVHASAPVIATDEAFYYTHTLNTVVEITEELEKIILLGLKFEDLPDRISMHILRSEVIPAINTYVREHHIEAMVIGSRDKYDFFDKWIGTISLGLVKTVNVPVYMIPRYAEYRSYKKVLVASDFHFKNEAFAERIMRWNSQHKAYVKFLHVQSDSAAPFDDEQAMIVKKLFEDREASFSFEIEVKRSGEVSSSILESAYAMEADLLIVIAENQSFVGSLLFKSMSKELILRSDVPILFLHPKDKY